MGLDGITTVWYPITFSAGIVQHFIQRWHQTGNFTPKVYEWSVSFARIQNCANAPNVNSTLGCLFIGL